MSDMNRWKMLLKRIQRSPLVLSIPKILLLFVVLELWLQIFSLGRYFLSIIQYNRNLSQKESQEWIFSDPRYSWWLEESPGITASYSPLLGWVTNDIHTPHISVENGTRKTVRNPSDTNTTPHRAYLLGGSTIWGYQAKNEETIPSYLASLLNMNTPAWEIYNHGEIGYTQSQEITKLTQLLKRDISPDIVVFYDGCNDLRLNTPTGKKNEAISQNLLTEKLGDMYTYVKEQPPENLSLFSTKAFRDLQNFFFLYIKLYRYPGKLWEKVRGTDMSSDESIPAQITNEDLDNAANAIAAEYEHNARIIRSLAQTYGFRYALVWQPQLIDKKNRSELEEKLREQHYVNDENTAVWEQATALIKAKNIPNFFDLTTVFEQHDQTLFTDRCHLTAEGNKVIAKHLKDIIYQIK